jgi:flagellar FliJ protein
MGWQRSLVRIADHEVEELRKRLVDILDRKAQAEFRLAMLHAEAEAEQAHAAEDAEAGLYRIGYMEGWRMRRDAVLVSIAEIEAEEAGCRDALSTAFENLKKYEQVEEAALDTAAKDRARLDRIALDELGQRTAARK